MARKYNLTDTQLRHLAIICYREQGTNDAGVRACASHMCNYFERYQTKHFKDVYECTFGSGWYWSKAKNEAWVAAHPNVPASVVSAVTDVIKYGKRTLPNYVDEYDCLSDVKLIINNGRTYTMERDKDYVLNRANYIPNKTIIQNIYAKSSSERYTFYCFPDGVNGYCDAFGYIYKGNTSENDSVASESVTEVSRGLTSYKLSEIKTYAVGYGVALLQSILDLLGYVGSNGKPLTVDGEFGMNTASALMDFQKAAGLAEDGVCGSKTWQKLKDALKI